MEEKSINWRNTKILLGVNIGLLVFRIIWAYTGQVSLNSEEAQYWLWSRHLALSYYSKPPLIAYLLHCSTAIFGMNVLGIRINSILIGFILPIINYKLAIALFKNTKIAFYSTLILFSLPYYNYISMFFSTDALVVFFWSLSMLFSWKVLRENRTKDWLLLGLSVGLGTMSKYTMILWLPAFLLICLSEKNRIFRNRRFYFSLAVACCICLPMILWNLEQNDIGARHICGLMGAYQTQFSIGEAISRMAAYVGGQLVSLSPFYVPAFYVLFKKWEQRSFARARLEARLLAVPLYLPVNSLFARRWSKKELSPENKAINFLVIPMIMVLTFFFVLSFRKTEINWTYFAYGAVPLLAAWSFTHFFTERRMKAAIGVTSLLIFFIVCPSFFDAVGLKKVYPPKIDLFHQMAGWDVMGQHVTGIQKQINSKNLFLFSDSYQIASEMAFYTDGNPQTYCINNGRRMNQFDIWKGIEQFENRGYDAIYVSYSPLPVGLQKAFSRCELKTMLPRMYRGKEVEPPFYIYVLHGFSRYDDPDTQSY